MPLAALGRRIDAGPMTIATRMARVASACAAVSLVLVACGGSSGEASKSAATILSDANHAASAATSVHVQGTVSAQGQNVPIDLRIGPAGAVGTGSFLGTNVDIIRVGDNIYVRGAAKVLGGFLGPQVATKVANHWVEIPVSMPQLAQFAGLADKKQLVDQLLTAGKTPSKAGTRTVNGQKVIALKGFGTDGTSTLLVAASGTPYPVQLVGSGGTLTFSDWNSTVNVTKPTDVVALATLTG